MVKKKLLALGVSVAAISAVAGAGFAGWTFTSEAKKEHNMGLFVTAAYSFGTINVDNNQPDTVILDQSGVTLAKSGALDTAIANVTATWTVNTVSYTDAEAAGLTYAVNVYVKDSLATYVNCGTTSAEATSAMTGYTQYVFTPTTSDAASGDNTVVTMTIANPLEYTSSKPANFADYQAMVSAITSETSVVTDKDYTVNSADKPVIIEFAVTKATA